MTINTKLEYDSAQVDFRTIKVTLDNAATTGDTFNVDLDEYGATGIDSIIGYHHSTENEAVTQEDPSTSISGSTLTVTVGGTDSTGKKVYYIGLHQ